MLPHRFDSGLLSWHSLVKLHLLHHVGMGIRLVFIVRFVFLLHFSISDSAWFNYVSAARAAFIRNLLSLPLALVIFMRLLRGALVFSVGLETLAGSGRGDKTVHLLRLVRLICLVSLRKQSTSRIFDCLPKYVRLLDLFVVWRQSWGVFEFRTI